MVDEEKQKVQITVYKILIQDFTDILISDFLHLINTNLSLIPTEYKETASIGITEEYENAYTIDAEEYLTIFYERMETDDEFKERVETRKRRLKQFEDREKEEYERLKKKFEKSDK